MSEQYEAYLTATTDAKQEGPDDSEPSPERQAALQAAYEANVAASRAPYESVTIRTRGELSWVMRERRWSGELQEPEGYMRPNLNGALLDGVNLRGTQLIEADLNGALLDRANLRGANLNGVYLDGALLGLANLRGTQLVEAHLRGANLDGASLSGAVLFRADLTGSNFGGANLSGANLSATNLSRARLHKARMDVSTDLQNARLDSYTHLADVVWDGVPLTRLNWQDVTILGEEKEAQQSRDVYGKRKGKETRLKNYADAVLANRQVATVLRSQGLNEHADRFAFRAQLCQRRLLRLQRHYLRYLGSLFLGMIAGYGYRPLRSVVAYVLIILTFAGAYLLNAQFAAPHLTWDEALVLSISSFHGRGFFTSGISLGNNLARLAAGEAIIGLLIEITFIATFTQRFFAR